MSTERIRFGGAAALGMTVRHLRHSRGLTQAELAAHAEMSPNAIGAIERGDVQNPGLLSIGCIASALDVGPDVLGAAFVQPVGGMSIPVLLGRGAHVRPQRAGRNPRAGAGGSPRALGAALRDLRARAGFTQASLAEAAQLGRGYISELERGKTKDPGLLTITQLAVALAGISEHDAIIRVVVRLTRAFAGASGASLGMPG